MAGPQVDGAYLDEYERLISELHEEIAAYGALRHDLGRIADSLNRVRSSQLASEQRLQTLVEQASALVGALEPLHKEVTEASHAHQETLRQGIDDIAGRVDNAARTLGMSLGEVNGHARAAEDRADEIKRVVDALEQSFASLGMEVAAVRNAQRTITFMLAATLIAVLLVAIGTFV